MEHKHTPGPWTNHGRIPQPGLPHSAVAANTLIARVYSEAFDDEEQEAANARLIAAAPDLLEALQMAVRRLDELCDQHNEGGTFAASHARAAIAKATGSRQ